MTTTTRTAATLITTIRQVDGTHREIYAQDERHAQIARRLLRDDPALIDRLHGIDGIEISIVDE